VLRRTLGPSPSQSCVTYGTLTRSGRPFQQRSATRLVSYSVITLLCDLNGRQPRCGIGSSLYHRIGLGFSRFAHRYYGNALFSSGY
jgi:hypothetical protein